VLLICYSIPDFVALANSEKTMCCASIRKLAQPFKKIKKRLKNIIYSFCANLLLISCSLPDTVAPFPTFENP